LTSTQNYINHIALVLDRSVSMSALADQVIQVADAEMAHMAQRSKDLDQETRVTVYQFGDKVECLISDKDVLRLDSLKGRYKISGNTALIDATLLAIDDLAQTFQKYGDHSFLIYVITDGENNVNNHRARELRQRIEGLGDNWTVAVFVPHARAKREAQDYGFPAGNVEIWDPARGFGEVGSTVRQTTETFMTGRAHGVRGYKTGGLFNVDTANLTRTVVAQNLQKLHPGQYRTFQVLDTEPIAPFVESRTGRPYRLGEAYYQLSKSEKIQPQKEVALYDKRTREVYIGPNARQILGLPDYEQRVAPTDHPDYDIYVQSTSVNRKLVPGTYVLILS
jgi:hypothetical protein